MHLGVSLTQNCEANENVSCTLLHLLLESVLDQKLGFTQYIFGML